MCGTADDAVATYCCERLDHGAIEYEGVLLERKIGPGDSAARQVADRLESPRFDLSEQPSPYSIVVVRADCDSNRCLRRIEAILDVLEGMDR